MIILLIGIAVLVVMCLLLSKFSEKMSKFEKIAVIFFEVLSYITVFLPDRWAEDFCEDLPSLLAISDPVFSLVRLVSAAMLVLLPIAIIYKRKNFARLSVFLGVPCFLANCFYAIQYINFYCYECTGFAFGEATKSVVTNVWFRAILFALIELIKLFIVLQIMLRQKDNLKFTSLGDFCGFIGLSIPMLLVNMPITFPAQFFGTFSEIYLYSANWVDFVWLAIVIAEIVVLALAFKNKSDEDKYIVLLVLALSLFFQFNCFYLCRTPITISRLPLQLCNIACYAFPIAVFFRKKALACFGVCINVFGALVAWIVCDTPGGDGLFYALNPHYIVTHSNLIIMGMLFLIFGFIGSFTKRDYFNMLKVYGCYYLFALIFGTLCNSIYKATGNGYFSHNFLFMFRREFIADLLPPFAVLFDISIKFGPYVEFTLMDIFMLVSLSGIGTGLFFIYRAIFKNKPAMSLDSLGR